MGIEIACAISAFEYENIVSGITILNKPVKSVQWPLTLPPSSGSHTISLTDTTFV